MWLFAFTIPWEKIILMDSFGSIARLVGAVAVVLGFLAMLQERRLRALVLPQAFLILFVGWSAASYAWTLDRESSVSQIFTMVQLLGMSILIWNLCDEEREQSSMLRAYVFGTFIAAIATFWQYRSQHEFAYQRYAAAGTDPNDLGLVLALSLPIAYDLSLRSRGWLMWVFRLQIAVALSAIALTASRGAMIASGVALLLVVVPTFRLLPRSQKLGLIAMIFAAIIITISFIPQASLERLATTSSELKGADLNHRVFYWAAAMELFVEHPLGGVGSGAFNEAASPLVGSADKPLAAHNTFLSVLVETGLVGFILFTSFLILLLVSVKQLSKGNRQLWVALLATWVVGVSALTWENRKPTWFLFSLLLAQCASGAKANWISSRLVCASSLPALTVLSPERRT